MNIDILKEKKVAVILALIIMIVGSIAYFMMNTVADNELGKSMNITGGLAGEVPGTDANKTGIMPVINNEELV